MASLEAVQIREAIIEDINTSTPAAMFEGSLNDWQETMTGIESDDDVNAPEEERKSTQVDLEAQM